MIDETPKKWVVELSGCDDTTWLIIDVTAHEVNLLNKLAELSQWEGGGCKPTMELRPLTEKDCQTCGCDSWCGHRRDEE